MAFSIHTLLGLSLGYFVTHVQVFTTVEWFIYHIPPCYTLNLQRKKFLVQETESHSSDKFTKKLFGLLTILGLCFKPKCWLQFVKVVNGFQSGADILR